MIVAHACRTRLGLIGVIALLDGCGPKPSANIETKPQPQSEAQKAGSDPGPSEAPTTRFWVVDDGLRAYDLDGQRVAEIGEIGDHARRLPDGRVVVLEQTGENLAVVVLDQSGKVSLRAPIPNSFDPETCVVAQPGAELDEHGWGLNVQEANAFAVDVEHDQACLQLQDRNDNMAELGLFVAVGLGGGEIQTAITFTIEGSCEDSPGIPDPTCSKSAVGTPWIEPAPATAPAEQAFAFAFDENSHTVTRDGQPGARLCHPDAAADDEWAPCSTVESTSGTGRWLLLDGLRSEGDYIYRDVVLLDRTTGELLQVVVSDAASTFIAVTPAQIFDDERAESVVGMVGESEVVWLPEDRLWIDGVLLIPGERKLVNIDGELVRAL